MANDAHATHLADQAVAYSKETFDMFHIVYHLIANETGKTGNDLIVECMKKMRPVLEAKISQATIDDAVTAAMNLASLVFVGIDKGHGS